MTSRRDFLKHAAMLSGSAGLAGFLPASIVRAMELNPAAGSSYLDAEHIVILMQENRSFDHSFGSLRGVRGFNDPRAVIQPDGNPVWLQTNKAGETYAPFRLDIKKTKSTWMGDVPHSRHSQVDAFNGGAHNNWLDAKKLSNPKYRQMPMTLGYYTRQDIPFYYALADAFTICDQNFSSAMTSTHPNRLFFWTGTVREKQEAGAKANIRNSDSAPGKHTWTTFPERLEENGISWKFYQNDLTAGGGLTGEERSWLANFGCNPLEWFKNYNVKFTDRYINGLINQNKQLPDQIVELENKLKTSAAEEIKKIEAEIAAKTKVLENAKNELAAFSEQRYKELSEKLKNLHERGFTTNKTDPDFRSVAKFAYEENGREETATMPKSDILHQFREDVNTGKLPAVSWLTAPQNFSDHPSAPWYGAWMVSEVMDILTKNPEVWKKTIFIITYDENDGYFDHQPPFVAPRPGEPTTGKCSGKFDTGVEHISREEELKFGEKPNEARSGPVGLGFRVPMIVASPWSRGGKVCSQVFDHTSVLMFMEHFFSKKLGKDILETNITPWRRTVSGNLTAVFSELSSQKKSPAALGQKEYIQVINSAKLAPEPDNYFKLSADDIAAIKKAGIKSNLLARQEPGMRPSCALPYELAADVAFANGIFKLTLKAGNRLFAERAAGAPFKVYFHPLNGTAGDTGFVRDYAVGAGEMLEDEWSIQEPMTFRVHGPNGFYRSFHIEKSAAPFVLSFAQDKGRSGILKISTDKDAAVRYNSYTYDKPKDLKTGSQQTTLVDLSESKGWYDLEIKSTGFLAHFAGRIETGEESVSDPLMA